jgi:hypothetical protein
LSDEQIDLIYNYGEKNLAHFSARLLTKYFSRDELVAKKMTRSSEIENLDPIRIGFIKSHLQDRNGGPLSDEQWRQCKHQIYKYQWYHINYLKKLKNKSKND